MMNKELQEFFDQKGIQKGVMKRKTGCDVIITDKDEIPGAGIFNM